MVENKFEMWPLVSIITPLFNAEAFILKTIGSVQDQTYQNWEMIIVDDCSTDNGATLVKEKAKNDKRIKIVCNDSNLGSGESRNKGIELAKGKYISFLDADDQWLPFKLERQITFMEKANKNFTFAYYRLVNDKGEVIGSRDRFPSKVSYKDTLKSNKIGCLTAVYNANALGKVYMEIIRKRQDYTLWLKLLRKTDYAYCIPEILAEYTVRKNSISSNKFKLFKYNWKVLREIEHLSVLKSAYYLSFHLIYKIMNK